MVASFRTKLNGVSQQIIAIGGAGFSMEPDNLALERYILAQSDASSPRVCFIPTASGDSDNYVRRFYESMCTLDCKPRHLSLFHSPPANLRSFVLEHDIIYVGGGNTRNMLAIWRDWGLDLIIKSAYESGIILTGVSAGSICWFEQGVTDSMKPIGSDTLASIECLGFLKGSNCPHYASEEFRRSEYHRLLNAGEIVDGWAVDDGVVLHFVDGSLKVIVTSRSTAFAYRVKRGDEEVEEERIQPQLLNS